MFKNLTLTLLAGLFTVMPTMMFATEPSPPQTATLPCESVQSRAERVAALRQLRFGMFICWSLSTFTDREYSQGISDVNVFNPTGCDVEQWCQVAKDAGMTHILFLTKHHDGFALWDTKVHDFKVTKSPLKRDVTAELAAACRKHGLKLAFYYSPGDEAFKRLKLDNKAGVKAQLKELLTDYGPIEFFWTDTGQEWGQEITEWAHQFQPRCSIGFNRHNPKWVNPDVIEPTECGTFGPPVFPGGIIREFTYIYRAHALDAGPTPQPPPGQPGGAAWFYSRYACKPEDGRLGGPPMGLIKDYLGSVQYENIFDPNIQPNHEGRIRGIDAKALRSIGQWIGERRDVIDGWRGGPFQGDGKPWGVSLAKDNRIALFLWSCAKPLRFPPIKAKITGSRIRGSEVAPIIRQTDQGVFISVPDKGQTPSMTIVELTIDGNAADLTPVSTEDFGVISIPGGLKIAATSGLKNISGEPAFLTDGKILTAWGGIKSVPDGEDITIELDLGKAMPLAGVEIQSISPRFRNKIEVESAGSWMAVSGATETSYGKDLVENTAYEQTDAKVTRVSVIVQRTNFAPVTTKGIRLKIPATKTESRLDINEIRIFSPAE